eukprot:1127370-Prymnesium_polylepis.2
MLGRPRLGAASVAFGRSIWLSARLTCPGPVALVAGAASGGDGGVARQVRALARVGQIVDGHLEQRRARPLARLLTAHTGRGARPPHTPIDAVRHGHGLWSPSWHEAPARSPAARGDRAARGGEGAPCVPFVLLLARRWLVICAPGGRTPAEM